MKQSKAIIKFWPNCFEKKVRNQNFTYCCRKDFWSVDPKNILFLDLCMYVLGDKVMVKKKPITDNCIGISMLWQNSLWPNILQSVRKKGMQKWTEPFYFFPDASQRATCLSKYDVIGKAANCIEIWKPNICILAFLSIVFNNKYGRNNCLVFKDSTALPMSEFSYPYVFTKYF